MAWFPERHAYPAPVQGELTVTPCAVTQGRSVKVRARKVAVMAGAFIARFFITVESKTGGIERGPASALDLDGWV
jgi:hypothetical protein